MQLIEKLKDTYSLKSDDLFLVIVLAIPAPPPDRFSGILCILAAIF